MFSEIRIILDNYQKKIGRLMKYWIGKTMFKRLPNSEKFSSELCKKIQYFAHSAIFHYNTSRTFSFFLLSNCWIFFTHQTHRHFLKFLYFNFFFFKVHILWEGHLKKSSTCFMTLLISTGLYYHCQSQEEYSIKFLWSYKNV